MPTPPAQPTSHVASVTYRRAVAADLDLLVTLRCEFVAEVSGHPASDDVRANVRAYFARATPAGECISWLAEDDGRAIATGCVAFYDLPPNARHPTGRHAYILNMFTRPGRRRQGIAAEIVRRLADDVRAAGLGNVTLHALPAGRRVYDAAGFRPTDDEMNLNV